MTFYELISLNSKLLTTLHSNGIKTEDYRHLKIYEDYKDMAARGEKITYIVSVLSTTYDLCERTIYRLIEFFNSTAIM